MKEWIKWTCSTCLRSAKIICASLLSPLSYTQYRMKKDTLAHEDKEIKSSFRFNNEFKFYTINTFYLRNTLLSFDNLFLLANQALIYFQPNTNIHRQIIRHESKIDKPVIL